MKYKVALLPHDVLIKNEKKIHELLDQMQKFLITPANERGSFDGLHLIHAIADLKKALAANYEYTNERPAHDSSILWAQDGSHRNNQPVS